jgi:hypothetical protein
MRDGVVSELASSETGLCVEVRWRDTKRNWNYWEISGAKPISRSPTYGTSLRLYACQPIP